MGAAAIGLLGPLYSSPIPSAGTHQVRRARRVECTVTGALHDLFSVPTFLGIPAAAIAFGRAFASDGQRGWAAYSIGSALTMFVAFGSTSAAFNQQAALVDVGGALQRITISIGFGWLTALGVHFLRSLPNA